MPIHTYTNWNSRPNDDEEQIEPFRKYYFICEGKNTETFYFRRLIDLRKQLGIHPLIDIRLWEKTGEDENLSYAKQLAEFAEKQKADRSSAFVLVVEMAGVGPASKTTSTRISPSASSVGIFA